MSKNYRRVKRERNNSDSDLRIKSRDNENKEKLCAEINYDAFYTSDQVCISYAYFDDRVKTDCGCYESDHKPAVLLIPSVGSDSNYWTCLIQALCPVANVYAVDLPMVMGSVQIPVANLTLANLARYYMELINSLGIDKIYLVGQGLGGLIALYLGVIYPSRVVKIVASGANPQLFPIPGSSWTFTANPQLQQLISQALAPNANVDQLAPLINNLLDPIECEAKEALIIQYKNQIEQYRLYLQAYRSINFLPMVTQVSQPVLLMAGTKDPLVPVGAVNYLNANLPNSALVQFYNQGQNIAILNTELYNDNVFNFFFVRCDPCCAYLNNIEPINNCDCNCDCDDDYQCEQLCNQNIYNNFDSYTNRIVIPNRYIN